RAVIEAAVANGRYICTLDPEIAAQRDIDLRARLGEGKDVRSFRAVIPGLTAGILDEQPGSEAVGLLFVQPPMAGVLLDEMLGDDWALVACVGVEVAQSVAGRPVRVILTEGDDDTLREWFAAFGCVAALVRPDRYVFGTAATAAEVPGLVARAARQLPTPKAQAVA